MALGKFMAASVLLFMCTAGISVSAAPFSIQRLEDRINSSEISFSYTYSVSGGKVSMTGQGSAVLQGDAYILDVDGMEVYCDGTARWTLDRKAEELVVESCDTYPASLSANPVLLLQSPTSFFDVSSQSAAVYSGMDAIKVELAPKQGTQLKAVTLYFRSGQHEDGILIGASVRAADGTVTDFTISDFRYSAKGDASRFSFDAGSLGPEWIVTDLR